MQAQLSKAAERLIAWWVALPERWNATALIVAGWAVLVLPLVWFRGFNSDDGLAVEIARAAIEDGEWITPHFANLRYVERPALLSWLIALVSLPFGSVSQFTARLPIVLSLLAGCLAIFALLRRTASLPAALFGAAVFLACPLVLRAYVATTADLSLAVLLFLAFIVWWDGFDAKRLTLVRWVGIGLILALAALLKGPQPVAYFFFGVGLFVLLTRAWAQIPGLMLAGIVCLIPVAAWYLYVFAPGDETTWGTFMRLDESRSAPLPGPFRASLRLILDTLPAALPAALFLITERFRGTPRAPSVFVMALACYAFACTVVILFWPGGAASRYFFPMVPPLCVLAGLGFDALSSRRPVAAASALCLTFGILAYAAVYSVVASPLLPEQFRSSKIEGERIAALMRATPAPIYRWGDVALNELAYVPMRILRVDRATLEKLRGPAWIIVTPAEADALIAKRSENLRLVTPFGRTGQWSLLRLDG